MFNFHGLSFGVGFWGPPEIGSLQCYVRKTRRDETNQKVDLHAISGKISFVAEISIHSIYDGTEGLDVGIPPRERKSC